MDKKTSGGEGLLTPGDRSPFGVGRREGTLWAEIRLNGPIPC